MSIQAVAWVLDNSQSKGSARLILISLANHASEANDWECWPATRTLAREAGVASASTACSAINALAELGEIEIVSRGDSRHPGRYRLTFMGERSESGHSVQSPRAASSPGRAQRPVQAGQNRNEPERTIESPRKRKPKTELPTPFVVSDSMKAWVAKNYPDLDWRAATAQWVAAMRQDDVMHRDWTRAWHTGMHRHVQWYGDGTRSRQPARTHL